MISEAAGQRVCPSAPASPGTDLVGAVTPVGRVVFVTPAIPLTQQLLDALDDGDGPLERRYRFAGPCVTAACGYWDGARCGLAARLTESIAEIADDESISVRGLPRCGIRAHCRWFAEQSASACMACSYVALDTRSEMAQPAAQSQK